MGPWQALVAESVRTKNEKLFHAARTGNVALLEEMLRKGVDVGTRNKDGETALHQAARAEQIPTMEALLDHRADLRDADLGGRQPLHTAIEKGRPQAIAFLASRGADIHELHELDVSDITFGDMNALHWAAVCGQVDSVKALLDTGADVNARSSIGYQAIHYATAVTDNPPPIIDALVARGADINTPDPDGNTPFHLINILKNDDPDWSAFVFSDALISLDRGLPIGLDRDQRARDTIDSLLAHGADPLIVNRAGLRPLEKDGTPEELSRIDQHILGRTEEPRNTARRVM